MLTLVALVATCTASELAHAQGGWTATSLSGPPASPNFVFRGVSPTQQFGSYIAVGPSQHAAVWNFATASLVDLHPATAYMSEALGVSALQQVGFVTFPGHTYEDHASLWSGTAESWVDLAPPGAYVSRALGVAAGQQVGYVDFRAGLWSGTAASWVDLHPASALSSQARGTSGTRQVGLALVGDPNSPISHASLWSGTAQSWVDLHPANALVSQANAVSGAQQVGWAWFQGGGGPNAGMWNGGASSWVNLHPAGVVGESDARATNGTFQAGTVIYAVWNPDLGDWDGELHASLWHGTSSSWEDLRYATPGGLAEASSVWADASTLYVLATPVGGAGAVILSRPLCSADYNRSGHVTVIDIFDFLNGWFEGDLQADYNGRGLGVSDIFDFLSAWFAGC